MNPNAYAFWGCPAQRHGHLRGRLHPVLLQSEEHRQMEAVVVPSREWVEEIIMISMSANLIGVRQVITIIYRTRL
jgi:hypothetical protein